MPVPSSVPVLIKFPGSVFTITDKASKGNSRLLKKTMFCDTLLYNPVYAQKKAEVNEDVSFSDIQDIPVLIGRIGEDPSRDLLEWYKYAGYTPEINYYNGLFSQCAERVRIREGIVVSGMSLCKSLARDGLTVHPFPNAEEKMNHYLVWKADRTYPGYMNNLIFCLRKCARGILLSPAYPPLLSAASGRKKKGLLCI